MSGWVTVDEESADPDAERNGRIARCLAVLRDTARSEAIRQAAHDELNRLGPISTPNQRRAPGEQDSDAVHP